MRQQYFAQRSQAIKSRLPKLLGVGRKKDSHCALFWSPRFTQELPLSYNLPPKKGGWGWKGSQAQCQDLLAWPKTTSPFNRAASSLLSHLAQADSVTLQLQMRGLPKAAFQLPSLPPRPSPASLAGPSVRLPSPNPGSP